MKIPSLETERLLLLTPSQDAFSTYLKFYSSQQASHFYGGPLSDEQIWARLKADLGSWYLLGFGVWMLREKETNSFVGTCGFWKGKDWPTELTWWLLPCARSKGYAIEASKAAIEYAYSEFNWHYVETYMNDENLPARNLVTKLGGVKSNRCKFPDGLERDIFRLPRKNSGIKPIGQEIDS